MGTAPRAAITLCARLTLDPLLTGGVSMGDKDFIKPLLERRGTVFFGKVCLCCPVVWFCVVSFHFLSFIAKRRILRQGVFVLPCFVFPCCVFLSSFLLAQAGQAPAAAVGAAPASPWPLRAPSLLVLSCRPPPAGQDEARQAADLCQGARAGAEQVRS